MLFNIYLTTVYFIKLTPSTVAHAPPVNEAPVAAALIVQFVAGRKLAADNVKVACPEMKVIGELVIFTLFNLILPPAIW